MKQSESKVEQAQYLSSMKKATRASKVQENASNCIASVNTSSLMHHHSSSAVNKMSPWPIVAARRAPHISRCWWN